MFHFSSCSVKVEVELLAQAYYPGQQVEGVVTLAVQHPFLVKNIHLKLVGREQVHTMVDEVKESRTAEVQFGITSQDYVYYRDVVTLVGDLLTRRRRPSALHRPPRTQPLELCQPLPGGGASTNSSFGVGFYDDRSMIGECLLGGSPPAGGEPCEHFRVVGQEDQPGGQRNLSFAALSASEAAAAQGGYVVYPEGTYTYPFCVTLPAELPPTYETGVCVKDHQFSNSRSTLTYYAKVYIQYYKKDKCVVAEGERGGEGNARSVKESDYQTASSDATVFTVLPMQPTAPNRTFVGCDHIHLREEKRVVACRFPLKKSFFNFGSLFGGKEKKKKDADAHGDTTESVPHDEDDAAETTAEADKDKLAVCIGLSDNHYQIAKDRIEVKCSLHNTTKKDVEGFKVSVIQQLTFHTVKAEVHMTNVVLEYKFAERDAHTVRPQEKKTVVLQTEVLPARKVSVPTLSTTGLHVHYDVRVEVLHDELSVRHYDFEGVVLTGVAEQRDESEIPTGEMTFVALTPGTLTRPEAFYVLPAQPCAAANLPQLDTLSVRGSALPSRVNTPHHRES